MHRCTRINIIELPFSLNIYTKIRPKILELLIYLPFIPYARNTFAEEIDCINTRTLHKLYTK